MLQKTRNGTLPIRTGRPSGNAHQRRKALRAAGARVVFENGSEITFRKGVTAEIFDISPLFGIGPMTYGKWEPA